MRERVGKEGREDTREMDEGKERRGREGGREREGEEEEREEGDRREEGERRERGGREGDYTCTAMKRYK